MPVTIQLRGSLDLDDPAAAPGDGLTAPIEVLAWSWGMGGILGTDSGPARVNVQDLSLTKYIDHSSLALGRACSGGRRLRRAVLFAQTSSAAPVAHYTITMEDALLANIAMGGSGGEDRLTENICITFARVTVAHAVADGGPAGSYAWTRPADA